MGIFSQSKPNAETLARLEDYNECYATVLECNVYMAEQIGFISTAESGREHAKVIARWIRIARTSKEEKAREVLATFESDFKEHIDLAEKLQNSYKSKCGREFDPEEVQRAKESGWKLL
jgi:hypothetical protein